MISGTHLQSGLWLSGVPADLLIGGIHHLCIVCHNCTEWNINLVLGDLFSKVEIAFEYCFDVV